MLDYLLKQFDYDKRSTSLRTVGFLHSRLSSTFIEVDRPTAYISRVKRHRTIEINNSISQFGPTVLPALIAAWNCCAITKEVLDIISTSDQNISTSDTPWLNNCLDIPGTPFTPTTLSPTETATYQPPSSVLQAVKRMNKGQQKEDASLKRLQYLLFAAFRPLNILGHELSVDSNNSNQDLYFHILRDTRRLLLHTSVSVTQCRNNIAYTTLAYNK